MRTFDPRGRTLADLCDWLAREVPQREALVHPERGLRLNYAELDRRSHELACALVALGLQPGERVTVWSDNRPDWIPLQFAIARAGGVLVTANTALSEREIGYLLRQSRSAFVCTSPGLRGDESLAALESLRAQPGALPELRAVLVLEGAPRAGMSTLAAAVEQGRAVDAREIERRSRALAPGDPANIQYTSGTTGFPKGVVLSHANMLENACAVASGIGLHERDRVLLQVPLFHCFGCVITLLGALANTAPLVVLQRFDPLRALEAIERERCTILHGVPTMFLALLSHPEFARFRIESPRAGVMAGAVCPEPLMRRVIAELGASGMLVAYGLTECSPAVTMSRPTDAPDVRCGTVGRALDGVEIAVVDPESGRPRLPGDVGELWVRGPNVMLGYFEQPQATAEVLTHDGWLKTGDLATLDEHGLVRIRGRIKELILRGGENVYPAEVEHALRLHPSIRDAAVYGIASEHYGEEVAAAVVLHAGCALEVAELDTFLEQRLARFKRPTRMHIVDALPLTSSGKVQKFRLREQLDGTAGSAPVTNTD